MIVANPSVFEQHMCSALSALAAEFAPLCACVGTAGEEPAARAIHGRLSTTDFSRGVLQRHPETHVVLPVSGIEWNNLGDPIRVLATQRRVVGRALVSA